MNQFTEDLPVGDLVHRHAPEHCGNFAVRHAPGHGKISVRGFYFTLKVLEQHATTGIRSPWRNPLSRPKLLCLQVSIGGIPTKQDDKPAQDLQMAGFRGRKVG